MASKAQVTTNTTRFSWYRDDIECKLGLTGGRFTRVNHLLWMIVALFLTVAFYAAIWFLPYRQFVDMFTQRGATQYATVFFTFWVAVILLAKYSKTSTQRKPLSFTDLVPPAADFVLGPATVDGVLNKLRSSCDDPTKYVLFNRIDMALANLRNMGDIGDVDDVLQSQASNDDDVMESSYSLTKGLIWAIPVLGFIGTVQGLAVAIGGFGAVLSKSADIAELRPALQSVTAGLSTAFETTFVALVAALLMTLLLAVVRKGEEEMLDDCKEYCQRYIVGRLRLTPSSS